MKRTKVTRIDENLYEMMEHGRKQMQLATGRRISMAEYTEMLSILGKPFMSLKKKG